MVIDLLMILIYLISTEQHKQISNIHTFIILTKKQIYLSIEILFQVLLPLLEKEFGRRERRLIKSKHFKSGNNKFNLKNQLNYLSYFYCWQELPIQSKINMIFSVNSKDGINLIYKVIFVPEHIYIYYVRQVSSVSH